MSGEKISEATLFAALSGLFKPDEALRTLAQVPGTFDLAMEATRLADLCDLSPTRHDDLWLMRTPVRYSIIDTLKNRGRLAIQVAWRRARGVDEATSDLLAVLLDEPPLSRTQISQTLENASARSELERIILALDRAGEAAPGHDLLRKARAALGRFERREKMAHLAERGFFGREPEWLRIREWLKQPYDVPPVGCLFLSGVAGVGKSTLLGETVRRLAEVDQPLILRLDFDRAGLDVQDQLGLTMEAARQLAEQLEGSLDELLKARMEAGLIADRHARDNQSARQRLPQELAASLGKAVEKSKRKVLVVLDTLEVLRGRGESHPGRLLRWLDRLVELDVKPMQVIAGGRGDALDSLRLLPGSAANQPQRRIERIDLRGLEDAAAVALLAKLGTPESYHQGLLDMAQGNPLKLRLGAELAKGGAPLPQRELDKEVSAAFLYRLLLSRITDPMLQKLAHPGLIVRRINARVIGEVLAPALGLAALNAERADEAFEHLASHHWLVEPDPGAPGYLKHRSDMRALLLPLLYTEAPELAAQVDEAAMHWFAGQEQQWARVESLYHRLQLSRRDGALPDLSSLDAALFDNEMLEELPTRAADYLRNLRAERSSELRADWAPSSDFDGASIVSECLTLLKRQDWIEASYLIRTIGERHELPMHSPAADAVRTLLWRSGQWAQARRWLTARDAHMPTDDDLADLPEELALARLEMRVESNPVPLHLRWWRGWRPQCERLERAVSTASDDCARHGALGLMLGNLPDPYLFTPAREGDRPLALAVNEIWVGGGGENARLALEAGRRRLARFELGAEVLHKVESGRVLATLTPYASFVRHLSLLPENSALMDSATNFAKAVVEAGGLFDTDFPITVKSDSGDPVTRLVDLGLFADWAQSCAFVEGNQDLLRIGRSAERWRRTVAGNWSLGRRLRRWRTLPLDQTSEIRLGRLLTAEDGVQQAQRQLEIWNRAVLERGFRPKTHWRLKHFARWTSPGQEHTDVARTITRQLLLRGIPAVFAPAVALLILNAEL